LTLLSSDSQDAVMADEIGEFVDVPDGFLYCQTRGQGQDVVLINAGSADLRMWETTVSWLSRVARVTTFDCRDTGLSSPGTKPYSEIEDIAAVMDARGVRCAVLVGVSDGARRALAFAHRYPQRATRVVVVDGTFGEFPDPSPEESAARQEMHDHFARRERILASAGMRAAAEAGGRDFESTQLWAKRIVSQAPATSCTTIPEADHFPMLSAPQQFEHFLRETLG
jgi:3-oxoadipate enol-lactonase